MLSALRFRKVALQTTCNMVQNPYSLSSMATNIFVRDTQARQNDMSSAV